MMKTLKKIIQKSIIIQVTEVTSYLRKWQPFNFPELWNNISFENLAAFLSIFQTKCLTRQQQAAFAPSI